jgi:hypothetical protein
MGGDLSLTRASLKLGCLFAICALAALGSSKVAGATSFKDRSYVVASSNARSISAPTRSDAESKLWYKAGHWWGVLWDTGSGAFHIFRLEPSTHAWIDTNVAVDGRNRSQVDALSAGSKLYVATHIYDKDAGRGRARLYRYTYRPAQNKYTADSGFPVGINRSRSRTLVLAKESDRNVLWATWVQAVAPGKRHVFVAKGRRGGRAWGTPFRIPKSGTVGYDDISSVVAFGKKVGVMWSDSNSGDRNGFRFAAHSNGAGSSRWSLKSPYPRGERLVDDHINMKTYAGRVYAIVKTASRGINIDGPVLVLLVRERDGTWKNYPVASNSSGLQNPALLIDTDARMLHVFANGPNWEPGTIFEKSSPLDSPSFVVAGSGSAFIADPADPKLYFPTTTKQNVNATSGIVVLASNTANKRYYHGEG